MPKKCAHVCTQSKRRIQADTRHVRIPQEHATVAIRNLSVHDECEAKVVTEGALPPLIYLLRHEIKAVQEQAVGALRNLSVIPENKNRIAKEGGVPPLILLLKSNVDKIQELAACTVHNLSAAR